MALGVDIGGTKIRVVGIEIMLPGDRIVVRGAVEAPTPRSGGAPVLATVAGLAARIMSPNVAVCGVGTAGVVDVRNGTIRSATSSIPDWVGTAVTADLTVSLGIPVIVDNDGNCCALAESSYGAARGRASALVVTVGTGIGGGVLIGGTVWRGAHYSGGNIGHVTVPEALGRSCTCGGSGHIEAVASGPAMVARYHERQGDSGVRRFEEVASRASCGDSLAAEVIRDGARALGRCLADVVHVLDPEVVVVGGGVAQRNSLFLLELGRAYRAALVPYVRTLPLLPAALGPDAVAIGAGILALRELGSKELP
jgi:glucokinase